MGAKKKLFFRIAATSHTCAISNLIYIPMQHPLPPRTTPHPLSIIVGHVCASSLPEGKMQFIIVLQQSIGISTWRGVASVGCDFPPISPRVDDEHEDALLAPTAPSSLGESMLKMARERAYVKNLSLLCVCVVRVVWEWIFSFHPSCIIQQPGLGKSIRWGDFIVENSVCQWRDGAMVRG